MATTNLLQWNPSAVSQETDAQYVADAQRTGGAVDDSPFPAATGNKLFYQLSTFVAAFGQMMAGKGYSTSDADINVLAGVLANVITSADQPAQLATLPYSTAPAFNAAASSGFAMTLAGNINSMTLNGAQAGQLIAFYFSQDGVGGHTVNFPGSFYGAVQPDPRANSTTVFLFRIDAAGNARALVAASADGLFSSGLTTGPIVGTSLTFAAGAPAGHTLVGNGTSFADYACYQSVRGGAAVGVAYQNTGSRPVVTEVTCSFGNSGSMSLTRTGLPALIAAYTNNGGGGQATLTCVVMPGSTCTLAVNGGFTGINTWIETAI